MQIIQKSGRCFWGAAVLLAAVLFGGCATNDFTHDPLRDAKAHKPPVGGKLEVGDQVTVTFNDVVNLIPPITQTIKDDGTITLIYNKQFQAAGRTIVELEKEIHDFYVPAYFKNMTPNITTEQRFYFVGGQVNSPNRQLYTGRIRVTGAIDTAGGFTEYAKKSKIQVTRADGTKLKVNYNDALDDPNKNPEVYPGDQVYVPKRIL